ncbi:MAG TPA: hypothetical protein VNF75_01025 [Candidatus Dormibacteraeota bacterium]|nr:hypothetical protein [Candidatus Dormibacteraeota bacterium]
MYDRRGEDGKRAYTVAQIAAVLGVTQGTIYAALEREQRARPTRHRDANAQAPATC